MGCNASLPASTLTGAGGGMRARGRAASEDLRKAVEAASDPAAVEASRRAAARAQDDALAMFSANEGQAFRDKYVRATLVFTAAHRSTNEAVAIKAIKKEGDGRGQEQQRRRVMLEGHPHAVRLLDVYEDAKAYHLVMEMLGGETQTEGPCDAK
ncbi:hypothetical protein MNEG_5757 [Monoraphidium neglectum]|uniref:Protein kinase domain-containing protein n=1 Tax=Monoraphidium neglectum TaxID=145388 RepID=A0A0D2JTI1_9CHLO|nr:hypothetical protein MNEG_5757 [Monoraphidium neglectum]KIZ02198.1 hypothetical protein MNEG_5757 [Monoraphidium neglectum]|eukprot:XP_013901217.1 hypothetical protein MNEG_5757 [Monoraphidium neglectum]